jgi:hypothetical protein
MVVGWVGGEQERGNGGRWQWQFWRGGRRDERRACVCLLGDLGARVGMKSYMERGAGTPVLLLAHWIGVEHRLFH